MYGRYSSQNTPAQMRNKTCYCWLMGKGKISAEGKFTLFLLVVAILIVLAIMNKWI
jgi:hypothetical protein